MENEPACCPCIAFVLVRFHLLRYYVIGYGKSKDYSTEISPEPRPQADGPGARGTPPLSLRLPHRADLWPVDTALYPLLRRQDPSEPAWGKGCGALSLPPCHRRKGVGLHPAASPECPGFSLPGCPAQVP